MLFEDQSKLLCLLERFYLRANSLAEFFVRYLGDQVFNFGHRRNVQNLRDVIGKLYSLLLLEDLFVLRPRVTFSLYSLSLIRFQRAILVKFRYAETILLGKLKQDRFRFPKNRLRWKCRGEWLRHPLVDKLPGFVHRLNGFIRPNRSR